jgi:radical SAM superfamily enzyme with C-terminal helix-hairpin-helix motif
MVQSSSVAILQQLMLEIQMKHEMKDRAVGSYVLIVKLNVQSNPSVVLHMAD